MSLENHVAESGDGRREHVLGTTLTYKVEPGQTNGTLMCVEISVPPGQGVPPHRHDDEDESFYVLAGLIRINGDGCPAEGTRLGPGSFFFGPRGKVHGFRCDGAATAKLLVFITPGHAIAGMFAELAALTGPEVDPDAIGAICGRYNINFQPA